MSEADDIMKMGDYIVIKRQNYMKLHKISQKLTVMLGKNKLEIDCIVGQPFSSIFKMEPKKKERQVFVLQECEKDVSLLEQLQKEFTSGSDNRNISGDGNSQLLSKEEIVGFRDSGMSGSAIVGQLLENSKTFEEKTEYSQKKYLKKKEKKYFDFVSILKPTIRLVSEIIYQQDPEKILGLRCDMLSQLVTAVGVSSGGTYIIYESNCEGLPTASMLNYLGDSGYVLHTYPDLVPPKQAILAMNFSEAQKNCLVSVNIQTLFEKLEVDPSKYSGSTVQVVCNSDINESKVLSNSANSAENNERNVSNVLLSTASDCENKHLNPGSDSNAKSIVENSETGSSSNSDEVNIHAEHCVVKQVCGVDVTDEQLERKRKFSGPIEDNSKKPRWELNAEKAVSILKNNKADGLVVVAKEDPTNIVLAFLPYLNLSRNFAVYCSFREPLVELYRQLKRRQGVLDMHLTESFLRMHQVLPNRTHPDIVMSGCGGYILTGTVISVEDYDTK